MGISSAMERLIELLVVTFAGVPRRSLLAGYGQVCWSCFFQSAEADLQPSRWFVLIDQPVSVLASGLTYRSSFATRIESNRYCSHLVLN